MKACMAKVVEPEAQFGGGYARPTAQGELESRIGKLWPLAGCGHKSAIPSHPQSRGLNEQTGRLTMSQLHHAEMRDRLSWWTCLVTSPVWRRSLHRTQRLPVMG